jgi:hypothetical protein
MGDDTLTQDKMENYMEINYNQKADQIILKIHTEKNTNYLKKRWYVS